MYFAHQIVLGNYETTLAILICDVKYSSCKLTNYKQKKDCDPLMFIILHSQ